MKKIFGIIAIVITLTLPVICGAETKTTVNVKISPAETLKETASEINNILHAMHESLEIAVNELQAVGITGKAATDSLQKLLEANEFAFDCATIDTKGVIANIAPKEETKLIGIDISHQEHILKVLETKKPAVNAKINTVEGFSGFDLVYPLFNDDGTFIGAASILTKPEFFGQIIDQRIALHGFEIFIMEKNGRIIYDENKEEIGLNLFKDELYAPFKSLLAAGHDMIRSKSGEGSYVFLDKKLKSSVSKTILWTTIELHDTKLRLALVYVQNGQ